MNLFMKVYDIGAFALAPVVLSIVILIIVDQKQIGKIILEMSLPDSFRVTNQKSLQYAFFDQLFHDRPDRFF